VRPQPYAKQVDLAAQSVSCGMTGGFYEPEGAPTLCRCSALPLGTDRRLRHRIFLSTGATSPLRKTFAGDMNCKISKEHLHAVETLGIHPVAAGKRAVKETN